MYLNVHVPRLQTDAGVASILVNHRGRRFASSVLMDPISKVFIDKLETFAQERGVPLLTFGKGQRKEAG